MKSAATALLVLVFSFQSLLAQNTLGLREIISYEKQEYNAGAQNWDIRQDIQGRIYFANNEGLLSFDGTYWKLYPLPNSTIVRSIEFGKDNRIYIGAQDEIGYFTPDKNGKLSYTSLKELLSPADQKFADIWDIVIFNDDIFFRSSNKIFQYGNGKIKVFDPSSTWLYLGLANGQLVAQDQGRGVLSFVNGKWESLLDNSHLSQSFHISSTISFGKDSSIITTHKDGIFQLIGTRLQPLMLTGLELNPYQDFSGAVKTDEDNFIVGTYTNGFYLINKNGTVIENLSKSEGLQNSNVRSLFSDRNHNIWLGLESGIDFIAFNSSIKHINPAVMNDGAGYAVVLYDKSLYFGMSNGVYKLPLTSIRDLSYTKNSFTTISEGQIWGLSIVNNCLLAGKDEGFYQITDNTIRPIVKGIGFWTFQPLQNIQSSVIVAGNYHGVRLFEVRDNTFYDKGSIGNFAESARFVAVDNDNTIWVSHPYRGVYRIRLNDPRDSTIKLYTKTEGLPSALKNHVYKIKNRIVVATEKGIYEYNARTDAFEPSAYFKEIFGEQSIRYLKEDPNGNIWFIQEKNIGVVDFSTLKPSIIYLPELKGKMLSGFENVYPVNDNNIFVGSEKGFYHINFEKYKQNNHPLSVYIRTVKAIGDRDSLLFGGYFGNVNEDRVQPSEMVPAMSHQWNSFHVEYSSPLFEQHSNIEYRYLLEGFDKNWSEWSKKTEKDYTNLPAGTYTFMVRVRNNLGTESTAPSYSFTVLPPWYQSNRAYLVYIVIFLYLCYLLYRVQHKRFVSQKQKYEERQKHIAYLHQLELDKSEKEVIKLKNEKLETEIEFKNSELASTAMHLVQKEEFIGKIKEELQQLNKTSKGKDETADLKKILRTLSDEEKLNKDWEQFAVHFNKVHSDFLFTLKEKFPGLNAHELKLCAYLRMNLSSKEIAQLMSISVRGVEIGRYRLRKKLQLATEVNLFQFLFDIHLAKKQNEST
jgi:ligand-binding sensor domain-containing protein/DNA-binding CsgD family transcriptional regulator